MAKIVVIHGIGQQYLGANQILEKWVPPINDGLNAANAQIDMALDVAAVFYGDIFRKGGTKGPPPPYTAADINNEWEQDMLEAWWIAAAAVDPSVAGPNDDAKVRVPNMVQRALNALSTYRPLASVAQKLLILDLKQVQAYLHDDNVRAQVQSRVSQVVDENTKVIIGHSLGSVVAYEAVAAHPEWNVETLITLGSPLGVRNLIFEKLRPAPERETGHWPGSVKAWHNIADNGDVVCLVKKLSPLFGNRIVDHLIYNGGSAHDVNRYLSSREFGDALANGL